MPALDTVELVNAISRASDLPVFIKDAAGRYLLVNQHLADLWEQSIEEILGKRDTDLLSTEHAERMRTHDQLVLRSGRTHQLEEHLEFRGQPRVYLTTKVPLFDEWGRVCGLCGIASDVSQLSRCAGDASSSEFHSFAKTTSDLVWLAKVDQQVTFLNQAWQRLTGRPTQELLGLGWRELIHPDDRRALWRLERAFEEGTPFQVRLRLKAKGGAYRHYVVAGLPRRGSEGQVHGFMGQCTDVTSRLSAGRSSVPPLDSMGSSHLEDVASLLGHNLRNPLTVVRTALALLERRREELPEDLHQAVRVASERMAEAARVVALLDEEFGDHAAGSSSGPPPAASLHSNPLAGLDSEKTVSALQILVVDDNRDAADTLKELLEAMGHEASAVHDGLAALELSSKRDFDVVLLDIGLPVHDGHWVAQQLRARSGTQPLLIAVTGYGNKEFVDRSREVGIDHHLVKPVDIGQLQRIFASSSLH